METLPQPQDVQYFIEVVRTLNLSRAAERIGIAQPTLSLAMQRLEAATKLKLLIRSKTGVQLTRAGVRFAADAKILLEKWASLVAEAQRDEREVRGRVTIGCHPSVALYTLDQTVADLLKQHQDLELKLEHDLSRRILERIISFEIDVALVINPVQHPDLRLKELLRDEVGLWARRDCANSDVLIYDPELRQAQSILDRLKKSPSIAFRRTIESSNLEVIANLAAAGAGVAILPGRVAGREPHRELKPWWEGKGPAPKVQDRLFLATRADRDRSQAVIAVCAALSRKLEREP